MISGHRIKEEDTCLDVGNKTMHRICATAVRKRRGSLKTTPPAPATPKAIEEAEDEEGHGAPTMPVKRTCVAPAVPEQEREPPRKKTAAPV